MWHLSYIIYYMKYFCGAVIVANTLLQLMDIIIFRVMLTLYIQFCNQFTYPLPFFNCLNLVLPYMFRNNLVFLNIFSNVIK
jgi:hypothetical protein